MLERFGLYGRSNFEIKKRKERRMNKMNQIEERKGYAKKCRMCIERIWMQRCNDGRWRPFDFPSIGNKDWQLHKCDGW